MRRMISNSLLPIATLLCVGLSCSNPATPSGSGSLRVAASTTGTPPDADGYVVQVNDNGNGLDPRVAVNGSVTLPNLPTGAHLVRLLDIAANCTVNGVNPLPVTIQADALPCNCDKLLITGRQPTRDR